MIGTHERFLPAPDQRCCGTCKSLRAEVLPGDGEDLTCAILTARGTLDAIGALWWGSACTTWTKREPGPGETVPASGPASPPASVDAPPTPTDPETAP